MNYWLKYFEVFGTRYDRASKAFPYNGSNLERIGIANNISRQLGILHKNQTDEVQYMRVLIATEKELEMMRASGIKVKDFRYIIAGFEDLYKIVKVMDG